jgi:hypothetical protein
VHVSSAGGGNINMEGAMEVHTTGQLSLTKLQVISDYGANILYNDNNEAKSFSDLNLRKFRSDVLVNLDLTMVNSVGIASIQNNIQGAIVKPNPFENYFDLDFVAESGVYSAELYNTIGERVSTLFTGELATGNIHLTFNSLAGLRNGIYFLKIQSGSSCQVLKICQAR